MSSVQTYSFQIQTYSSNLWTCVSTVSCSYPNVPMQLIIVFKFHFLLCKSYFLLCLLGQSFIFLFKFSWPSCHIPPCMRCWSHMQASVDCHLCCYISVPAMPCGCKPHWSSYPLTVNFQLLLCPCHHPAVFCQFQFLPPTYSQQFCTAVPFLSRLNPSGLFCYTVLQFPSRFSCILDHVAFKFKYLRFFALNCTCRHFILFSVVHVILSCCFCTHIVQFHILLCLTVDLNQKTFQFQFLLCLWSCHAG